MVCADRDYLGTIDSIREQLPKVEHFITLTREAEGWLDYEAMLDASSAEFVRRDIRETDLLTINYTSGTTARPKGVMITHRNAWMNSIGTLLHAPMTCADRYLWTLPMFHANGWTFVWTVTAAGATHICLRKCEPRAVFELMATEQVTTLCAAPTQLLARPCRIEVAPRDRVKARVPVPLVPVARRCGAAERIADAVAGAVTLAPVVAQHPFGRRAHAGCSLLVSQGARRRSQHRGPPRAPAATRASPRGRAGRSPRGARRSASPPRGCAPRCARAAATAAA